MEREHVREVAMVPCYGHYDRRRDLQELQGYHDYLWAVAEDVQQRHIDTMILTGGQEQYCESEAASTCGQLQNFFLRLGHDCDIRLEVEGINTLQGLWKSLELYRMCRFHELRPRYYSDNHRQDKIRVFAILFQLLLLHRLDCSFTVCNRPDTHRMSNRFIQGIETLCLLFPPLMLWRLRQHK